MDWPRYLRAMRAEKIEAIEERRKLFMADKIEASDLSTEEWEAIREHDGWLNSGE